MTRRVLVTGSTGFVGRNIVPILEKRKDYIVFKPTRQELDLKDEKKLRNYLIENGIDIVLHLANPNPTKNSLDNKNYLAEDSLRIFMNFYNNRFLYNKMIYLGSGAEYDKSREIQYVEEKDIGKTIPYDSYGLAKFVMNSLCNNSGNIYNFRVFGCYGPADHESKFITHCIRSIILDKDVTIRKNCLFDYIHVFDLAEYLMWGIDNELKFNDYNVGYGRGVSLYDIAVRVTQKMKTDKSVVLLSEVKNNDYTANCDRIKKESHFEPRISIDEGISMQIAWEKDNWTDCTAFDGE